jgi:hypothetical protein
MPKRTNDFQKLIYLVQTNLSAGATVTESKMLPNRRTGKLREVDVCVEGTVGGTPVVVSIECSDRSRPADVHWVELNKTKHENLATNALILASRKGFTAEAKKLADTYNIQAISLDEVDSADFAEILGNKSSLWLKQWMMHPKRVAITVEATGNLPLEIVTAIADQAIYDRSGNFTGIAAQLVASIMGALHIQEKLLREGSEEHRWFEFGAEYAHEQAGVPYLEKLEPRCLRRITVVRVSGELQMAIQKFGVRRARLGNAEVAWGNVEVHGGQAVLVASREAGAGDKVNFYASAPINLR